MYKYSLHAFHLTWIANNTFKNRHQIESCSSTRQGVVHILENIVAS